MTDSLLDLARRFVDADARKKELDTEAKRAGAERDRLQEALLAQFELNPDLRNLKLNGSLVYLHRQTWARAAEGKREECVRVLVAMGYPREEVMTVNAQKLSAVVREQLAGGEMHPALAAAVEVEERVDVRVRKA